MTQEIKTIHLNRAEINRLQELMDTLYKDKKWGSVVLDVSGDNGIGSVLTATFIIQHDGIDGEFTVTISDERDW
jgi:hypothetical protein